MHVLCSKPKNSEMYKQKVKTSSFPLITTHIHTHCGLKYIYILLTKIDLCYTMCTVFLILTPSPKNNIMDIIPVSARCQDLSHLLHSYHMRVLLAPLGGQGTEM